MPRRWFRNWPVKLGAAGIAVALTFGFYGLIEANPLNGSTTSDPSTQGDTTNPVATQPPTTGGSSSQQVKPQPTPRPQPVQRVRRSRGS